MTLPSNRSALSVLDTASGELGIVSTAGTHHEASNSQDNSLGVGVDIPSQVTLFTTRLTNIPQGSGLGEEAGLWFGNDEDNYVRLVIVSGSQDYRIELTMEQD